jgi:hypothetical protein
VDKLLGATRKRVFLLHDVHRSGLELVQSRWAMSYLRGPLTRDEVSRLMAGRGSAAAAPKAVPAEVAAPPVVPAPLRHHYFRKYGGELADPHLLVKYAVRYRGTGETVGVRAYPLAASSVGEVLEAEAVDLDEAAVSTEAPPGIRYGEMPAFVAEVGARGLERVLKDRLPAKLAVKMFVDPATKAVSTPGETKEAFAKRIEGGGGGPAADKLRDELETKKRDLAIREQELSGRKTEKWTAVVGAVLSNVGLFTGRKRTISGATTVLTKNRLENTAEARVEALKTEVADLESKLAETTAVDPSRFQETEVVPAKGDVKVLRYDIVWVY